MRYCLNCGKLIKLVPNFSNLFTINRSLLCDSCINLLEYVTGGCKYCGKKINEEICNDCKYWRNNQETKMFSIRNYSLFYYNDFARNLIKKVKFLGDEELLNSFSAVIRSFIKYKHLNNFYLVPVPLHKERLLERGFNQSDIIAKMIKQPILNIMEKLNNDRQSKKKRVERIRFQQQYKMIRDVNLTGKKVLIIDDIYTTGATIHKIARLIFDKQPLELASFTLFRS